MRYIGVFWFFVAIGVLISITGSKFAHSLAGIPPGVPLARLGIEGRITQISLIILPFIIAPILTGWVFYWKMHRPPISKEIRRLTVRIAYSTVALSILFWIGSGAWFGLIQADPWMIFLMLVAPPAIVTVTFRVLFPTMVRALAYCTKILSNKGGG